MAIEYPTTIPDLLTRFGLNPLDFTSYTDLLRELQELFDVAGTNPQGGSATIGNRIGAVEAELASPALTVITADATTITNTTTETAFSNGFYTVPADSAVIGRTFRILAGGKTSSGSGNITFRVRWGSVNTDPLLVDVGPGAVVSSVTNRGWYFTGLVTVRTIGGSGTANGTGFSVTPASSADAGSLTMNDQATGTVTINTTAAKNLTLFVKWSVASASNLITLENFMVEQVH